MRRLMFAVVIVVVIAGLVGPAAAKKGIWRGRATYYASRYIGDTMACGGRYRHRKLVAAVDRGLAIPCGQTLRVKNRANGRFVTVTVKDQCTCHGRVIVDLSRRAARRLDYISAGVARVRVKKL
jgi:rare lipoprotein A